MCKTHSSECTLRSSRALYRFPTFLTFLTFHTFLSLLAFIDLIAFMTLISPYRAACNPSVLCVIIVRKYLSRHTQYGESLAILFPISSHLLCKKTVSKAASLLALRTRLHDIPIYLRQWSRKQKPPEQAIPLLRIGRSRIQSCVSPSMLQPQTAQRATQ